MIDRVKRLVGDLDRWSLSHRSTRVTRRAATGFVAHEGPQFAGSMAYFTVLSVFQLIVLGVIVGSFFVGEGEARALILEEVEANTPLDAATASGIIDAVIESRGAITIVTFVFLVWSALGGFGALSTGIGRAFEVPEKRPFWMERVLGLFLMGVTGALVLGSVVVGIVAGIVGRAAVDITGEARAAGPLVNIIGFAVPLILVFGAFWMIYRIVPNRPVSFAEVWPGALVATVLWTALRIGFTWYATGVANYESAFGPISTAITLLVFLYFASLIVLIGAEFAHASVLDDELPRGIAADPRFMPVPTGEGALPEPPPPRPRRGMPRWLLLAGGAVLGIVAGRLSKRDED